MARELVYSILSHNLKVYSRRGLNLWGDWILLPNCLYRDTAAPSKKPLHYSTVYVVYVCVLVSKRAYYD